MITTRSSPARRAGSVCPTATASGRSASTRAIPSAPRHGCTSTRPSASSRARHAATVRGSGSTRISGRSLIAPWPGWLARRAPAPAPPGMPSAPARAQRQQDPALERPSPMGGTVVSGGPREPAGARGAARARSGRARPAPRRPPRRPRRARTCRPGVSERTSVRDPGPAAASSASTPFGGERREAQVRAGTLDSPRAPRSALGAAARGHRDGVRLGVERTQRREAPGRLERAAGSATSIATIAAAPRRPHGARSRRSAGPVREPGAPRVARGAAPAGQVSVPATSHGSGTTSPSSVRVAARSAPRRRAAEDMTPR